ncbi:hypothetical protein SAMN05216244_2526 [Sediminibacillus halophilus]|uniref:MerR, DNA binding n=2 Tax=Sediminibacillus halophilus TaxID=482461 RepID=A0A1G9TCA8_9BACI|nr:hypothetical protein SAMN05216244_2526 [Sediminibacillus halophilus]
MKELGLSLNEIQWIVDRKQMNGCGFDQLIRGITDSLLALYERLEEEERAIRDKKRMAKDLLEALEYRN